MSLAKLDGIGELLLPGRAIFDVLGDLLQSMVVCMAASHLLSAK